MTPSFLKSFGCLFLARKDHAKTGSSVLAVVNAKDLVKMAKGFLAAGYYLEDVSGLDVTEGAVSVYHFDRFDIPKGRVTVMAVQPHEAASFPSIAGVYQGAEWHERETRDFYGYKYEGNPNLVPLLLSDDMMDVHPLVKEEGKRATLFTLFCGEGRMREVLKKDDSFTLLDAPAPELAAEPASEPAVEPEAPKAEAPAAAKPAEKGGDDA
jgi:NADH-quinone oxidoreductase subunit C